LYFYERFFLQSKDKLRFFRVWWNLDKIENKIQNKAKFEGFRIHCFWGFFSMKRNHKKIFLNQYIHEKQKKILFVLEIYWWMKLRKYFFFRSIWDDIHRTLEKNAFDLFFWVCQTSLFWGKKMQKWPHFMTSLSSKLLISSNNAFSCELPIRKIFNFETRCL